MKRALVQFEVETYRRLRERAFREGRSIAAVVREMVAQGLESERGPITRRRVSQFASVRAGHSKQGRLSPVSERHDEALPSASKK